MNGKVKFPRAVALEAARDVCAALKPVCDRLIVAGSLRRRKAEVGDVEVLFVPKFGTCHTPGELFPKYGDMAEAAILKLVSTGVLKPRKNRLGGTAMGPKNKLTVHAATGVPVDLFTATAANWWNYLVCRTGGKENNTRLALRAQETGYKWHPTHTGFERLSDGQIIPMDSERAVFEFLGLPYLEPWERP